MSPQAAPTPEQPVEESPEKRQLRVDRIKALIQQAASPHGDGSQAAARACALIRKFGLDIVDPSLVDSLHKEVHQLKLQLDAAKTGAPEPLPSFGGLGTPRRQPPRQNVSTSSSSFFGGFTQAPAPAPAPPPQPVPVFNAAAQPMTAPAYIAASKFAGRCKQCGKTIKVGDPVRWMKSAGVWCATTSCYADWANGQQQAAAFTSPFTAP